VTFQNDREALHDAQGGEAGGLITVIDELWE